MRKFKTLGCMVGLVLFLAMSGSMSSAAASGETVQFGDVNLEAAVRQGLNKPTGDITTGDMAGLTELDASARGIGDLSGIEYAVHLRTLNLSKNAIRDISKLGALASLETLVLNGNELTTIDPLANLQSLKSLWLANNQISDLGAIASLQQLEDLYMANNRIGSLTGLENLLQLKNLNLAKNRNGDIRPVTALTQLQSLNLEGNGFSDIHGMESLKQLQWLSIAYNPVRDIGAVGGLTQLKYLNLRGYAVSADSNRVLQDLGSKGTVVEYALVIPPGAYIYDVNLDGTADANDINDIINYYLNLNGMKTRHPELKINGNEIDPAQLDGSAYIYDVNRDGLVDANDINDAINGYLNLNDAKNKHPEFKVIVK